MKNRNAVFGAVGALFLVGAVANGLTPKTPEPASVTTGFPTTSVSSTYAPTSTTTTTTTDTTTTVPTTTTEAEPATAVAPPVTVTQPKTQAQTQKQTATQKQNTQTACGQDYYRNSAGNCVHRPTTNTAEAGAPS